MIHKSTTAALTALCMLATTVSMATAYHWPSPKLDAVEGLLYEHEPEPKGHGSLHAKLRGCVPQKNESTAAEYLRFAYHDAATHNIKDGTGGLDASVYYELDRDENVGSGMTVASSDFIGFATKYISKSDIIGIGAVLAVAECGGPSIPYRMGRVDSFVAGPPGVPMPTQDLATHIEIFRRQGFTQSEMIGLVACGHTLGGVRFPEFPYIVSPPPDGWQQINTFDTTPAYDNSVVTQYLDGTTQNPLVATSNTTNLSDLQIFSSDNNVTMKGMASPTAFANTCRDLLKRIINTVPKDVVLSDILQFIPVKVDSVQLSVKDGALNLKAMLRLSTANPSRTITMFWENRTGGPCNRSACSAPFVATNDTTAELTRRMGLAPQKYYFDTPINATTSISKFWFAVDEHDGKEPTVLNNGGTGYVIEQDHVLFDPARSTVSQSNKAFDIVRSDSPPSRVYANVMWRITTLSKDQTIDFVPATSFAPTAEYTFYHAPVPGPNFQFDLFSTVGGTTYSEDARDSRYVTGLNNTSPSRRAVQKRIDRENLRRESRERRAELRQRGGY